MNLGLSLSLTAQRGNVNVPVTPLDAGAAFDAEGRLLLDHTTPSLAAWIATFPAGSFLATSSISTAPVGNFVSNDGPNYRFSMLDPDTPGAFTTVSGTDRYDAFGRWRSFNAYTAATTLYFSIGVISPSGDLLGRTSVQVEVVPGASPAAFSGADGEVVLTGVEETATTVTFTIAAPAVYAGTYPVSVATLAEGTPVNLVPPVVAGGPTGDLTATSGLWVYDPTVYADAGVTPDVQFGWYSDGAQVPDETEAVYSRTSRGEITFREFFREALSIVEVSAVSNAVAAVAVTTTRVVGDGIANQFLTLDTGIFPVGRAWSAGVILDMHTAAQRGRIVGFESSATDGTGIQFSAGGSPGVGISTSTTTAADQSLFIVADGGDQLAMAVSWDLDGHGLGHRIKSFAKTATDELTGTEKFYAIADASPGETMRQPFTRMFARGNADRGSDITIYDFIWISDQPCDADLLAAALFEPDAMAPCGHRPRLLPSNGAVLVGGVVITPRIFLQGANLSQTETSPGVWGVPNYGTAGGTFTISNGPFV